ncbi:peptidoglycan-binding LysM [Dactylonectria macrodidyma]|uniref:Peptidoglycan-binding LysM n=1 Tax=Dactylonectria macrodidyma TaxID=307937 RepID=A0A9P9FIT6_9HYPO|nr:peptidoglycan-binding LysM [Dactylonectria macrodidyma]
MSRFSQYDTDEERLPEGMSRVGYDADTQVYTFRDSDGSYWESAPGCQYGHLTKVSDGDGDDDTAPFLAPAQPSSSKLSWRTEMGPLLNFGVLIGLFLIFLFWFLHWSAKSSAPGESVPACADGTTSYTVRGGDTCWDIADKHGLSVDDLLKTNDGLDCDALRVGSRVCLPTIPPNDDGDDDVKEPAV